MPNFTSIIMWAVLIYLALDALNVAVFKGSLPIPSLIEFAQGKGQKLG